MKQIDTGFFNVLHPYTRQKRTIDVRPEQFHSIVFWSKNYDRFLKARAGQKLQKKGFHLYFNFTVNSESQNLEPSLPSLSKRMEQLKKLSELFGPQTIAWRFDPICFYKEKNTRTEKNNLSDFEQIAALAGQLGIKKCVTSFFDTYKKIDRRLERLKSRKLLNLEFIQPGMDTRQRIIQWMSNVLKPQNISLFLCCEKKLFLTLKKDYGVLENACIDGKALKSIFGGHPEIRKDYGQRSKLGCQCTKSVDIGSYDQHPCAHNCLFCYANPMMDTQTKKSIPHEN